MVTNGAVLEGATKEVSDTNNSNKWSLKLMNSRNYGHMPIYRRDSI